jgi:hypothetical protein
MKKLRMLVFAAVGAVLLASAPVMAQQPRVSPPDVSGAVIDGSRVTVYYARPNLKDPKTGTPRKIWGGLVPFGKVWRTGANEAPMLVTQQPLDLGGTIVPAGAYTLFTLPAEDGSAKLIINRQLGQWGTQYDEKQDFARINLTKETLMTPVEQFTMSVTRAPGGTGGVLKMMWENLQYSVPFSVLKVQQ